MTTTVDARLVAVRRAAPLAGAMLLGLLLIPVTPGWDSHPLNALAASLVVVLLAVLLAQPWMRLPVWTTAIPVCLLVPAVGLLRHAHGGSASGYAPLALLPVLWLALHAGRRALVAGLALLATTFTVPLLVGRDLQLYPAGSWRLAVLLVLTGTVVGATAQRLTRQLGDLVCDLRAVGRVARSLPSDDRARVAVCAAAREVSTASFALLYEPDANGRLLVATAADGTASPPSLPLDEPFAVARAFRSGQSYFSAHCPTDDAVSPAMVGTGAVSMLLEPVVRNGAVVGVLVLGFGRRLRAVRSRVASTVSVLAAEAAQAIERADLVDRLSLSARTDGLTRAANRRGWEVAVEREAALAPRPRVLALLDLDHFKRFNDRNGHQTGDLLLQTCVRLWRSVLRPGDTLARWGGEEFAVLLPDCTLQDARDVLERLRAVMPAGCTVSIGAGLWAPGESARAALAGVDAALYAAKDAGRDRVVVRRAAISLLLPEVGLAAGGRGRPC